MSYKEEKLHCIVCPLSCSGKIVFQQNEITDISGFSCPRGIRYAQEEVTAPKRTLTTTVRVEGGALPLLPVISRTPLPKEEVLDCARALAEITIMAPVFEGDIITSNILNLGIDIVAARDITAAGAPL